MATITSCVRQLNDTSTTDSNGLTETVYYLVEVDDAKVTPAQMSVLPFASSDAINKDMPQYGDDHEVVSGITVTKKQAKRAIASNGKPAMYAWIVQVDYGPDSGGGGFVVGETTKSKNIRVEVQGIESTVFTEVQANADKSQILNAVGDRYPDPQELTLYDEMISISFESLLFNMTGASEARGLINNGTVTLNLPQGNLFFQRTFDKHTLRLAQVDYGVTVSFNDPTAHTWGIKLGLAWRKDGWDRKLPQKGFRWYVDDDGGEQQLTEWKETAAYLDENGYKLESGAELVTTYPIQLCVEGDLATILGGI